MKFWINQFYDRFLMYLVTYPSVYFRHSKYHHHPSSISTADILTFGARCAYLSVILISAWPSNSRTVFRSTPDMTKLLAKVWRMSCQRKFSISAFLRTVFHALLTLSRTPLSFGELLIYFMTSIPPSSDTMWSKEGLLNIMPGSVRFSVQPKVLDISRQY